MSLQSRLEAFINAIGADVKSISSSVSSKLDKTQNLNDLSNKATSRTNLGLGTAATQASTAFATSEQGAKADTAVQSANPTLTGTITLGGADTDVAKVRAATIETDDRAVTLAYTGADLTSVTEKDGAATVKSTAISYSDGRVVTVTETAGGVTVTTTLTYDGSGNITGTTRSVT